MRKKNNKIEVKGIAVTFTQTQQEDYICITDIAKFKNPEAPRDIIKNWMRTKNTFELLGLWEKLNNPNFKQVEFDLFKNEAGYNHFVLSPQKWISNTDALKENLIPQSLKPQQISHVYASEADVLNMALFGKTARQWQDQNPDEKGNIRDQANVSQLLCLANLENLNAIFIEEAYEQSLRLEKLNQIAIQQMKILLDDRGVGRLEVGDG